MQCLLIHWHPGDTMRKNPLVLLSSDVRSLRHSSLLVTLLFLLSASAFGQATGQIAGVVSDPAGRVLPSADIELLNTATSQLRNVISGPDGTFAIPLVNPGIYELKGSLAGFKINLTKGIEVAVNTTSRGDVQLQLGSTSVEVTVTSAAPLVETGNATLGTVVDHQSIVDLPLNGRNFAQLGTLIPGVIAAPASLGGANGNATVGGFGNVTGSFNVNGMRNQSNNFLLDGAPNNDSFNSGFVMRPPPDAIEEFKIMTHSYEAQYGRNAGSVVNVVTRSGTNQVHGNLWWFNRETALAAKNYFSTTKPNYQQNQFGGAAGSPIIKEKVFIFAYYEGFRLKDATSNVLNQPVLSSAERGGDFSELFVTTAADPGGAGHKCTALLQPNCTGRIIDPVAKTQFNFNNQPNVIDPT